MSLITLAKALEEAEKGRYALGNFDCFNLEMVKGVLKAAAELQAPVIIAYGEPFIEHIDMPYFTSAVKGMAETANIPVVLHTDHYTKLENIRQAIRYGFTSVMIDSSDKPYEVNVQNTRDAVKLAHESGVSVESELGHVSGLGDIFEDDSHVFTNPETAADFVERTGIDALAVSIGNVHGIYKAEPKLRFDILEKISAMTAVPLVLHGASGIPDEDIKRAVSLGIRKVNYYTDMCAAAAEKIDAEPGRHLFDLCRTIVEECYKAAYKKIQVLK
ncbi:MAG: class II fructose-bisphosphate aldolase [Lachnospiraceae bacterium]|nr:class II fructose-bisphosphate aldolase [Lachnospiraceae bacterium]